MNYCEAQQNEAIISWWSLKRIYYRYELWEDYHNGMFEDRSDDALLSLAIQCLSSSEVLKFGMERAVREWRYSGEMNMSNRSRNRQAWLGQAACSLLYGVPENITKMAWRQLAPDVRDRANAVADMVIAGWELDHFRESKVLKTNKLN